MRPILPPRGSIKAWLTKDTALLALGLVLLVLCGFAAHWLLQSAQTPPPHDSNVPEFFAAILAVLSWVVGWMLIATLEPNVTFAVGSDGIARPVPSSKRTSK